MATPNRPVLIDVDTQVDFMVPTGALYVPGAEHLTSNLATLVALARALGLPHLATRDTHTPDDPEFAAYGFPAHCVAGTAGVAAIAATHQADAQVLGAPAPLGDHREWAFPKATFDVFSNPAFSAAIRELQPSEALVMGVATDYCVKAAALGLRAMGVPVTLVEDAVAAVAAESGQAALRELAAAGVTFTTTAALVARLGREVAHVA